MSKHATEATSGARTADPGARTMRAAQITAFRQPLEVTDVPVSDPSPDGAIVRVEASGVCRSDWHFWNPDLEWVGFKSLDQSQTLWWRSCERKPQLRALMYGRG